MIWNLEVTNAVRGLEAGRRFYNEMLESVYNRDAFIKEACQELMQAIMESAFTLAIELDPRDLNIVRVPDPIMSAIKFICHWEPSERVVEMRGGALDGTVISVSSIDKVLAVPVDGSTMDIGQHIDFTQEPLIQIYALAGWNEDKRHWVFDLVPLPKEKT